MSPYTIEHWLRKGFTEEQAKIEIAKRRITNPLYWIEKGYSIENAKEKVREHQSKSAKANKGNDEFRKKCTTSIEYWITKGYDLEDAKHMLSDRQATFSLEKCIEKLGVEEGTKRWKERQDRWQNTLNNKSPEEREEINRKRNSNRRSSFFSKESMKIFLPVCEWLSSMGYSGEIFMASNDNKELKLFESSSDVNRYYFYDFSLLNLKIIIEYNGERFHPNPSWPKKKWKQWKQLYTKVGADYAYEYQKCKTEFAKKLGFKVLEIWSSTSKNKNIKICKEFIQNEINLFNKTGL